MACVDAAPFAGTRTSQDGSFQLWLDTVAELKNCSSVLRWDGRQKAHMQWDGLLYDSELWHKDADLNVFLHRDSIDAPGPSFSVNGRALDPYRYPGLLDSIQLKLDPTSGSKQLFIPYDRSLDQISKPDVLRFHLTTRNFFAYLMGVPLVGTSLAGAVVDLYHRVRVWTDRPLHSKETHIRDRRFVDYLVEMGYLDFTNCPGHTLAVLRLAEECIGQPRLRYELYARAFVHSVGMFRNLHTCHGFDTLSRVTRSQLKHSAVKLSRSLKDTQKSIFSFLEDDMSPDHIGLTTAMRSHLVRFQRFLSNYYSHKFEVWPPQADGSFPKSVYLSLSDDFRSLLSYLVDWNSTKDLVTQPPESSGLCVLQTVLSFDNRHRFISLDHPLPMLPSSAALAGSPMSERQTFPVLSASKTSASSTSLKQTKDEAVRKVGELLRQCSNGARKTQLVRMYVTSFESAPPTEKISVIDGRKIRWLLVYGMVQTLSAVLQTPGQVVETDDSPYPLCAPLPSVFPWRASSTVPSTPRTPKSPGSMPGSASRTMSFRSAIDSADFGYAIRPRKLTIDTDLQFSLDDPFDDPVDDWDGSAQFLADLTSSPSDAAQQQQFTIRPDCDTDHVANNRWSRQYPAGARSKHGSISRPATMVTDAQRQGRSLSLLIPRPRTQSLRRLRRNVSSKALPTEFAGMPVGEAVAGMIESTEAEGMIPIETGPTDVGRRSSLRIFGHQIAASFGSKKASGWAEKGVSVSPDYNQDGDWQYARADMTHSPALSSEDGQMEMHQLPTRTSTEVGVAHVLDLSRIRVEKVPVPVPVTGSPETGDESMGGIGIPKSDSLISKSSTRSEVTSPSQAQSKPAGRTGRRPRALDVRPASQYAEPSTRTEPTRTGRRPMSMVVPSASEVLPPLPPMPPMEQIPTSAGGVPVPTAVPGARTRASSMAANPMLLRLSSSMFRTRSKAVAAPMGEPTGPTNRPLSMFGSSFRKWKNGSG